MHLPDGFVSPQITLPAWAAAAPLWAWAVRRHFGRSAAESLPAVGALTALAFVVQTIMIPLPGGTSTHLVGVVLLAVLHGPLAAFACESLVLLLQALLLGAGGVTVLGVNALAMGLAGPLAGWATFRLLRRLSGRTALFLAGWTSTAVSTAVVAGALALQHRLDPQYLPAPVEVTLAAMLLPAMAVTGVIEGLYTLFAHGVLRRAGLPGAAGPGT